jgi:hypothetical protein
LVGRALRRDPRGAFLGACLRPGDQEVDEPLAPEETVPHRVALPLGDHERDKVAPASCLVAFFKSAELGPIGTRASPSPWMIQKGTPLRAATSIRSMGQSVVARAASCSGVSP